jgi:hypothetical protein
MPPRVRKNPKIIIKSSLEIPGEGNVMVLNGLRENVEKNVEHFVKILVLILLVRNIQSQIKKPLGQYQLKYIQLSLCYRNGI